MSDAMNDAMNDGQIDWVTRAGARAKGRRPAYFADPATDRTLSIVMAVVAEVSVLRERLDTVERLLETKGSITRADIEDYTPDRATGEERGLATKAYIARILRGVQQDMESLAANDPPVMHWVEELAKE